VTSVLHWMRCKAVKEKKVEDKKGAVDRKREFRNSNVGKAIFDESGDY